jgi:MinD-like ATPase involved in chromosome partitioning or flagellar assembly
VESGEHQGATPLPTPARRPQPRPLPRPRPRPVQPIGNGATTSPQQPNSARWIAVAGVCGRAGTTTMAALLGATYAAHRRYRIVVVDADPTGGALGVRLAGGSASTLAEIAAAAPGLTSFSRLAPYVERTSAGVWAVAGPGADLNACRDAIAALSPFFAVGVLDCGAIGHPQAGGVLGAAHARLLVAPMTVDGVLDAAGALDWLGVPDDPEARARCAAALVSSTPQPGTDLGRAVRLLTGRGARVVPVPYDPSLGVGGPYLPAAMSDGARAAIRRLATEMLARSARSGG